MLIGYKHGNRLACIATLYRSQDRPLERIDLCAVQWITMERENMQLYMEQTALSYQDACVKDLEKAVHVWRAVLKASMLQQYREQLQSESTGL